MSFELVDLGLPTAPGGNADSGTRMVWVSDTRIAILTNSEPDQVWATLYVDFYDIDFTSASVTYIHRATLSPSFLGYSFAYSGCPAVALGNNQLAVVTLEHRTSASNGRIVFWRINADGTTVRTSGPSTITNFTYTTAANGSATAQLENTGYSIGEAKLVAHGDGSATLLIRTSSATRKLLSNRITFTGTPVAGTWRERWSTASAWPVPADVVKVGTDLAVLGVNGFQSSAGALIRIPEDMAYSAPVALSTVYANAPVIPTTEGFNVLSVDAGLLTVDRRASNFDSLSSASFTGNPNLPFANSLGLPGLTMLTSNAFYGTYYYWLADTGSDELGTAFGMAQIDGIVRPEIPTYYDGTYTNIYTLASPEVVEIHLAGASRVMVLVHYSIGSGANADEWLLWSLVYSAVVPVPVPVLDAAPNLTRVRWR